MRLVTRTDITVANNLTWPVSKLLQVLRVSFSFSLVNLISALHIWGIIPTGLGPMMDRSEDIFCKTRARRASDYNYTLSYQALEM